MKDILCIFGVHCKHTVRDSKGHPIRKSKEAYHGSHYLGEDTYVKDQCCRCDKILWRMDEWDDPCGCS